MNRDGISTKHKDATEKTPQKDSPWKVLFDSLDEFSPDFMEDRNQPKQPIRSVRVTSME